MRREKVNSKTISKKNKKKMISRAGSREKENDS